MPARHTSRQRALQVLYQWDMTKLPMDEAISAYYESLYSEENAQRPDQDSFMEELARGASDMAPNLDKRIEHNSQHWRLERMPPVDRNILRLAIFEMTCQKTPIAIVIDEALELARQFSGEESVGFINGVLDAVHKELRN